MPRRLLAITVATFAALLGSQAVAIEMCPRSDRYTCVVDGDTLWIEGINYRLEGYDTPEEYRLFLREA